MGAGKELMKLSIQIESDMYCQLHFGGLTPRAKIPISKRMALGIYGY